METSLQTQHPDDYDMIEEEEEERFNDDTGNGGDVRGTAATEGEGEGDEGAPSPVDTEGGSTGRKAGRPRKRGGKATNPSSNLASEAPTDRPADGGVRKGKKRPTGSGIVERSVNGFYRNACRIGKMRELSYLGDLKPVGGKSKRGKDANGAAIESDGEGSSDSRKKPGVRVSAEAKKAFRRLLNHTLHFISEDLKFILMMEDKGTVKQGHCRAQIRAFFPPSRQQEILDYVDQHLLNYTRSLITNPLPVKPTPIPSA